MRRLVLLLLACAAVSCSPAATTAEKYLSERWKEVAEEPYPFSGDVPPLKRTVLDGTYVRTVPVAEVGEPVPCRRCPPYKIYAGEARLHLDRGRYYVSEEGSEFASQGHFVVEGSSVTFFNDPVCSRARVTYDFSLEEDRLSFEFLRDPCAFQNLRGRYFTTYVWERR